MKQGEITAWNPKITLQINGYSILQFLWNFSCHGNFLYGNVGYHKQLWMGLFCLSYNITAEPTSSKHFCHSSENKELHDCVSHVVICLLKCPSISGSPRCAQFIFCYGGHQPPEITICMKWDSIEYNNSHHSYI